MHTVMWAFYWKNRHRAISESHLTAVLSGENVHQPKKSGEFFVVSCWSKNGTAKTINLCCSV